jgi:hypothetical protein
MAFKTINTSDKTLQMLQDNIQAALPQERVTHSTLTTGTGGAPVISITQAASPFLTGNLITAALTSGQDNLIPHGLGRTPKVWFVARLDTNTNVWEATTSALATSSGNQSATDLYLNLKCGTSCNVTVWVS